MTKLFAWPFNYGKHPLFAGTLCLVLMGIAPDAFAHGVTDEKELVRRFIRQRRSDAWPPPGASFASLCPLGYRDSSSGSAFAAP